MRAHTRASSHIYMHSHITFFSEPYKQTAYIIAFITEYCPGCFLRMKIFSYMIIAESPTS